MREACPRCNLVFEREEGFFLGAYVVALAVTEAVLAAYIAVAMIATLPDPPVASIIAVGIPVVVLTPLVAYPFSKTTWAAIDFAMHPR